MFGWVSGFFSRIAQKPKFKIELITGPTFISTFETGRKFKQYNEHKTACALYLKITNVGTAPSSIADIKCAYKLNMLRSLYSWEWFPHTTITKEDFQIDLDEEKTKVYPHLYQLNQHGQSTETYLTVGKQTNGIIYFEGNTAWGGCQPRSLSGKAKIKISIVDTFGKSHSKVMKVEIVKLETALKFNSSFGKSLPLPEIE